MHDSEPSQMNAVLASAVPVAATVILHAAIGTALIAVVQPDVPDLVPYWLVSVLGPSATWAVLVLGRAVVWRQPSAFWLGSSAGVVVVLCFLFSFFLVVTPAFLPGVPLALLFSSWLLLACATGTAILLRVLGRQLDRPVDAEDDEPEPAAAVEAASGLEPASESEHGHEVEAEAASTIDPAPRAQQESQRSSRA